MHRERFNLLESILFFAAKELTGSGRVSYCPVIKAGSKLGGGFRDTLAYIPRIKLVTFPYKTSHIWKSGLKSKTPLRFKCYMHFFF